MVARTQHFQDNGRYILSFLVVSLLWSLLAEGYTAHDLNVLCFINVVVQSKDGTISVAAAFAGHQEGETIQVQQ